ncbi:Glutamate receptor ionotropic, kainate 4 [Takifugu flavidus]|uniref:Glutamate receptor ionotropic, kainate 4 n=1 Tax=Takifugu flavidus TaxID=433684 RepID=A0A5C6PG91_9TELE|nr:Glutamate receptor ionotropic, kainate 4 [Takifugu flavidus]
MSSHIPFKPRCTPLQSRTSSLTRQLPRSFAPWLSPPRALGGSYRLASSDELKQRHNCSCSGIKCLKERLKAATQADLSVSVQVPYVKVAPEDILKVHYPRFTTLDLRPTNTDISLAVAGLLTFFNSTTTCLICAQADCLLNLEQLLRRFLISKETLSVRMLDDSQDPTPVLKEIRDDKTATIVVDANTTMSHIILERVSVLLIAAASFML